MNIVIIILCLIILILLLYFTTRNRIVVTTNRSINVEYVQQISKLLSYCKNTPEFKNITISTNKDIEKYLNYLSCTCKGIGFWGGFCLNNNKEEVGHNFSHDDKLAEKLGLFLKNKRVADFGAGLGWYCPTISKSAKVCDQYDGSVNIEEVTDGRVKYLNLAEPITMQCNYDYVISIEVAEHIPKEFENIYLNNLIKCAREGIIITWATIGQGGHFHVNNKAKEDVIKLVESKGVKYNEKNTKDLADGTGPKFSYLKNNIMLFKFQ